MQWEYLHKTVDNYLCYQGDTDSNGKPKWIHINHLGIYRWELVTLRPISETMNLGVFKRERLDKDHEFDPDQPKIFYEDLR